MEPIIVEADNLQEAEKKLREQVPEGFEIFETKVLSQGKPFHYVGYGETIEEAFENAKTKYPKTATLTQENIETDCKDLPVRVKAKDETEAGTLASRDFRFASIKSINLLDKGSGGILGIGARPKTYEVIIHQKAIVHVTAQNKTRLKGKVRKIGESEKMRASSSVFVPNFPLNPQDLFDIGKTTDQDFVNISEVFWCMCTVFKELRSQLYEERLWPTFADNELNTLLNLYRKLLSNLPPHSIHNVDVKTIKELATKYVNELLKNDNFYSRFMNGEIKLTNLAIDFTNTIACGKMLELTLRWLEKLI